MKVTIIIIIITDELVGRHSIIYQNVYTCKKVF